MRSIPVKASRAHTRTIRPSYSQATHAELRNGAEDAFVHAVCLRALRRLAASIRAERQAFLAKLERA